LELLSSDPPPPHRAPPLSLHDCFALFTHWRERETDRYYYYHASAIMQRTQTAGSNRSWDCLYCGTFGSSDTNSIVCKNVENSQKLPFSMNQNLWRKLENHPSEYWKKIIFRPGIFKINWLIIQWTCVESAHAHCNIGHPCV
jgi:hypothetical protein